VTKRRFEETLEECLAALARGQSTVEECLALYPELAAELEPLLHTARTLQEAYAADPSPLYAQAARQRFLAAMARRRQRRLEARPVRPFWRWAPAALGSAAVVAFAVWASVLAWGGGGGGSQEASVVVAKVTPTSTPVPAATNVPAVPDIQGQVAKVQAQLEEIRTGAESGAVEAVAIEQLKNDTEELVASLDQPEALEPEAVSQIGELFADQEKVLSEVKERVSLQAAEDVDEIIRMAGAGRAKVEKLLLPTATPTVTPTATPSATPSATPTATPEESPISTATPTATPSATETPEVTPTQTPQPTSSPTPEGSEEPSPTATAAP